MIIGSYFLVIGLIFGILLIKFTHHAGPNHATTMESVISRERLIALSGSCLGIRVSFWHCPVSKDLRRRCIQVAKTALVAVMMCEKLAPLVQREVGNDLAR